MSKPFVVIAQEQRARWRVNPVLFVQEMFGAEPSDQQKALLMAVAPSGSKVSVKSGHGTGKSTTQAWLALWFLICFKNAKVPCTASSQSQLRDVLWSEIALWHAKMPKWWQDQIDITGEKVTVKGMEATQFAVARTAGKSNPDALQGFHAENILFIIDEASGVFNKIFEVASGALSTAGARVVMCGNPTQLTGYFYESHHKNRENWQRFTFSCLDSPHVDPAYAEQMAAEYGRDSDVFRVRVLGEFPRAAFNQLIPLDWVETAQARTIKETQFNFAAKIIGVDVAPYGGDRSAIFIRQGLYARLLWQKVGVDDITLGGIVAQFANQEKADAIFIDQGAGSGVGSTLKHSGHNPILIPFGSSPMDSKYLNKRAEMWGLMKDWIRDGGVLPNDGDLKADLIGPQYYYGPSGKLQLEKKEDMKKRGLASPDLADALALTFAFPVSPRQSLPYQNSTPEVANSDYEFY